MQQLRLEGLDRPYFLAYRVDDDHITLRSAILGSPVRRVDSHYRLLIVELRVGDPRLDNTHFLSFQPQGESLIASPNSTYRLPIDDDYSAIRRQVWLATDVAYKTAVADLAKKRTALTKLARPDRLPDLGSIEPSQVDATRTLPEADGEEGERLVTRLSALFNAMPALDRTDVRWELTLQDSTYVNSEGTCYSRTASDVAFVATATAQSDDKQMLEDAVTAFGQLPADLPSADALAARIVAMGKRLTRRRAAAALESYSGPVLFEAQAAAELLAQALVPSLLAQRPPVGGLYQLGMSGGQTKAFEAGVTRRVLPRFLSLVDDPTASQWVGHRLFGGYKVDDEGVLAQTTRLVDRGYLKTVLVDRAPVARAEVSTGSHRAGGIAPSNLVFIVEPGTGLTAKDLHHELLRLVGERKADFGIVVRLIGNPFFGPKDRPASRMRLIAAGGSDVGPILAAFKVYNDGREELLREVVLRDISPRTFRDIVAAGDEPQIVHRPFVPVNGNRFASGSTTGWVPLISMVVPALLFEDLTLAETAGDRRQLPISDPPIFGNSGDTCRLLTHWIRPHYGRKERYWTHRNEPSFSQELQSLGRLGRVHVSHELPVVH